MPARYPGPRAHAPLTAGIVEHFTTLTIPAAPSVGLAAAPFPPALREPTLDLASSHLVCSVALTGVLVLQAARWWSEQTDVDEPESSQPVTRAVSELMTDDDSARVVPAQRVAA